MLSALILVAASWAGSPPAPCADQTQMGLSACAAVEQEVAERELNTTYQSLISKLDLDDRERLRIAERSWVDWREKECTMRTGGGASAGGTIAPMLMSLCNRELARERSATLKNLIACGPSDLSCPAK